MQHLEFEYILFLHAFTGCDTTFTTSRRSKVGFTKLYLRTEAIRQAAVVFYNSTSTHEGVEEAGKLCSSNGKTDLPGSLSSKYGIQSFTRLVVNTKPDISSLPPTENAAKQKFMAHLPSKLYVCNNHTKYIIIV